MRKKPTKISNAQTWETFFEKYVLCGSVSVLKKIWRVRESRSDKLNISNDEIIDLAPIVNLPQLKKLDCSFTPIKDLSPIIKLPQLQEIDCSFTLVNNLAPIGRLKQLRSFACSGIPINKLPLLSNLTNLQQIDFSSTSISNLSPLYDLVQLKEINCHNTQIRDLSPLENLIQLQKLRCPSTKVNDLSPLAKLTKLEQLWCADTQISDLSPLVNLPQLKQLDCRNTKVRDLSPLTRANKLSRLWCADTQISDLSPIVNLPHLQQLDCRNTRVKDLSSLLYLIRKGFPVKWKNWDSGDGIYIKGCPLTIPPIETAKQGNNAILRWLEESRRSGFTKLAEARLLLVGQGGAGKTTFRCKLINAQSQLPPPDATTRGIDIETLRFDSEEGSFGLHLWDFGGQNIQHFAHSFFLSSNVVYALLTSEREQNDHLSYWLHTIELLGKGSPVIIVQNEKFGHSDDLKDKAGINERFGSDRMLQFHKLDLSQAATDDKFKKLKREICHIASGLPHIGREVLKSFQELRESIEQRDEQYIMYSEFERECANQGIKSRDLVRDYARSFHFLGICLYFEDDPFLEDYIFLRPKWIIDALFELLYEGERLRKSPIISENNTRHIWSGEAYNGMRGNLLRLMCNFEMCYPIKESKTYLIPQLLPVRDALFESKDQDTRVIFRYKFLPKGFITRLTCRLHEKIEGKKVWSDAVQFIQGNTVRVFARELYAENAIELIGRGIGKSELLNRVVDTLDNINQESKFVNLKVEKYIPCPCKSCKISDDPYFFEYDYLRRKLENGQINAECRKSLLNVLIRDILREVRAFSVQEIESMIASDRIEEALNLLRGQFENNTEIIQQMGRLELLEKEKHKGSLSNEGYFIEKNRIREAVVKILENV